MDRQIMSIDQLLHLHGLRKEVAAMTRCVELAVFGCEAEKEYQQRQSYDSKYSGNLSERLQSVAV